MVDDFNLTKENAKEYFFLNQCRLSFIWANGLENCNKFSGFGFDDQTLNSWTNEWLNSKLDNTEIKSDKFGFSSLICDLGHRIDGENAKKLIVVYNDIKTNFIDKKRIDVLFKHEYSEVLKEHFYYGLIYIAAKNKMQESISPLLAELNLLIKDHPQAIKKEYDKNLKKVFKMYGIIVPNK